MKATPIFALMLAVFVTAAYAGNEQCLMCHQDQEATTIASHQDCMSCHAAGSHLSDFRTAPPKVLDNACIACHEPSEAFDSNPAHSMDMACSSCHEIHKK